MIVAFIRNKQIDHHIKRLERFTALLKDTPFMLPTQIDNYQLLILQEQEVIMRLKGL